MAFQHSSALFAVVLAAVALAAPSPQRRAGSTIQAPAFHGQVDDALIGGYAVVGDAAVSAQQMFLGNDHQVYIIDKVENNPIKINGHPAWASVWDLNTKSDTALEVYTNTFCAGGGQLGNGTWLNAGGNPAADPNGVTSSAGSQLTGTNTYNNRNGTMSARVLTPGDGANWSENPAAALMSPRWYPSVETLQDGRLIVVGGSKDGAFINSDALTNPTWQIWPPASGETEQPSDFLTRTLYVNQYPLINLLPSGKIMMAADRGAALWDYQSNTEQHVDDIPHAVRNYPASAATAMLPLSPANSYTATILYCGGSDIAEADFQPASLVPLIDVPASTSCISITPDKAAVWVEEDPLPEGRVMGNGILLPDGTFLVINGAKKGVAGYNNDGGQPWQLQESLATDPSLLPLIYDPSKPAGSRWSSDGLKASTIPRMYHSSATLLPDGSVFVSGSNPHPDVNMTALYPTTYKVEIFYPPYFNKPRPTPSGIPTSVSYGGSAFDLQLTKDDLSGDASNKVKKIKIVLVRTGFSTHGLNFGMRNVELDYSFTINSDGGATLHVSQAPNSPSILPPGPAWFFVVVDGVPSVGVQTMVGSGQLGAQTTQDNTVLPASSDGSTGGVAGSGSNGTKNAATSAAPKVAGFAMIMGLSWLALL